MNADELAELRTEVLSDFFGAGGPVVLRLIDEIAELRRGLERVARWDGDPDRTAIATLARADAIGGGV